MDLYTTVEALVGQISTLQQRLAEQEKRLIKLEPKFTCPVCRWPALREDPALQNYDICPCCGTEFGNDDGHSTHGEIRAAWVDNGMTWFSGSTKPPVGWDPSEQLGDWLDQE